MKLLLLLALAAHPPMKLIVYRADLSPVAGGYPAIVDGPVLCGDRLLERGTDYQINGAVMRVTCPPGARVSTFLASWVFVPVPVIAPPPVQRRKP